MELLSEPHGGTLTQQVLSSKDSDLLLKDKNKYFSIKVDFETALEVENIATGVLSPLTGFMRKIDYLSVIKRDRLADDTPWTIPILFHLREEFDNAIGKNDTILLEYKGDTFAKLRVDEIYDIDLNETAESVFGTTSKDHPGVYQLLRKRNKVIGGRVELIKNVISATSEYMLSPKETRKIFEQKAGKPSLDSRPGT